VLPPGLGILTFTAKNFDTVKGTNQADTILGDRSNNILNGNGSNDLLNGRSGNDRLTGGDGSDVILGDFGNDWLSGGTGNDVLVGGTGQDVMYDGAGNDKFKYYSTNESGIGTFQRDVIIDLDRGFDKIDLSSIDADKNRFGNQAFRFIGTNSFSGTAGEVRYYRSGSAAIVQVDVQGDRNATSDMEIQLNNTSFITASDFVL